MEPETPLVTIAIATHDDEASVEACLRTALAQDYPANALEILVADSMSMDATREIILRVAEKDPRVRLIDNPHRTRAGALNAVVTQATGELIVPMDPGGAYGRSHVARCVEALSSPSADQLTIGARSSGRTLLERTLSAVQSTRLAFAGGGELGDDANALPALLGAVRRRVFDRVGLFDPKTRYEEDVELSRKVTQAGGSRTVRQDIVVHRADVSSFRGLFRRHYQLGRERGRRAVKDRRVSSIRELGPLGLVVVGGALLVTASIQPLTPIAAIVYALRTGAAAVRVGRREGIVTIPIALAAYPVMHVAQGAGFGAGVVRAAVRPDWNQTPDADIESVPASVV